MRDSFSREELMKKPRVISREMKLSALARMDAGENVSKLARELRVRRKLLYEWKERFRAGGPEALRHPGRPPAVEAVAVAAVDDELVQAKRQIAKLERKVGQQQLDLDFFRRALRQVQALRQAGERPGAVLSTRSSKR
jgi:transposase